MYDLIKIKEDLKSKLSEKRYNHCLMVASISEALASIYHENESDAYFAGLLHDIAKEFSDEENEYWIKKYNLSKDLLLPKYHKIIHADIGAVVVKELYNANDDICNAIKYHTIGNIKMNNFAKIIFIADKIGRENLSPEYEIIKKHASSNIDKALILYIKNNETKLANKGLEPHSDTIELLKFLEQQESK